MGFPSMNKMNPSPFTLLPIKELIRVVEKAVDTQEKNHGWKSTKKKKNHFHLRIFALVERMIRQGAGKRRVVSGGLVRKNREEGRKKEKDYPHPG